MLQINSTIPDENEHCELSQDIINACKIIGNKARIMADPSKISHISLPTDRSTFTLERSGHPIEILISLVSRSALNVCELIEDNHGNVKSIELPLELIEEKLSMFEISAEIILQHTIFDGRYMDRSFMVGTDFTYDSDERFNAPINMKYSEHNYAIFDLENGNDTFPIYKSERDCIAQIWKSVLCLYDRDLDQKAVESDYRIFMEFGRVDANFGKHIVKKSGELLNIYDSLDGKDFFLKQALKAKKSDSNELYNRFISNLRLVHKIFSENNEAVQDYICFDFKLAIQDIYTHLRRIGRICRYLIVRR